MKKLLAFGLLSIFMLVSVTLSLQAASNQKHDQTCKFEPYKLSSLKMEVVYINDAASPAVAPVYGKSVNVYAANASLLAVYKEVTPTANSPPLIRYRRNLTEKLPGITLV